MSQTVSLLTGTKFKQGVNRFQLAGTSSITFPDANDLDTVAEILASMNSRETENGLETTQNIVLNAAALNRQVIASGLPGITDGNAVNVTYGPKGQRINTDVGVPLANPTGLVQTAAPGASVIAVTFPAQVNSVLADYKTGFSCKVAGVARVINSAALQGGNLVIQLTLASAVTTGQAVLLSFDSSLSDLKNLAGAKIQSFTDLAITNTI